jgi:hypothetical protein
MGFSVNKNCHSEPKARNLSCRMPLTPVPEASVVWMFALEALTPAKSPRRLWCRWLHLRLILPTNFY